MTNAKTRTTPRPFELHWGRGRVAEEAAYVGEHHEPSIQLLEFEDGSLSVRFCYYDHAGRFQRSAQTVGGVAAGYSTRYFFDDEVEDYYQVPRRIKAITKESIEDIMQALFAENVWGIGVLGDCGDDFAGELHAQIAPLWQKTVQ